MSAQPPDPEPDGTIVIGPGCFAAADETVISWKGENYYRPAALPPPAGSGPAARYALVEQMGHKAMVGLIREITFCGKPMLEVQRIDVVPSVTVKVAPESLYDVTDLDAEQATGLARTYGRSTGGLDMAGVVTRYIHEHRQLTAADGEVVDATIADDPWGGDDSQDEDDDSRRELADEGNATAMSDAERAEYDRDGEAWLDAQDEAAELAREDGDYDTCEPTL